MLSDEERRFRKMGTGVPPSRWWPALAMVLAAIIVAATSHVVLDCTGLSLDGRGRGKGLLEMLLVYPCSPFLLRGAVADWLLLALLWIPLPFAVVNWRWAARQRRYWNEARRRGAERRRAKGKADKAEQKDG